MTRTLGFIGLLAAVGCNDVFGLEPPGPGVDCEMPPVFDHFEGTTPCAPWASSNMNNVELIQATGKLRIRTRTTTMGYGGCTSQDFIDFDARGILAEVSSVLDQDNGYTLFGMFRDRVPATALAVKLAVTPGRIALNNDDTGQAYGFITFVPDTMRWWRIRPNDAGTGLVGEVSDAGVVWQTVGEALGELPTEVKIDLGAGAFDATSTRGSGAAFESVNVCPGA